MRLFRCLARIPVVDDLIDLLGSITPRLNLVSFR
jgi:hypothetical protein